MAQDLPDDVWSQIAEDWCSNDAHRNMSLTNKQMYRLFAPLLFRYLGFSTTRAGSMAKLFQAIMRAKFLFNCPRLLWHTRFFKFWGNSYTVDSICSGTSSSMEDAGNLLAVFRDAVSRLIFRMPRLRELHIKCTEMTPLFYSAISSRPLLTSLSLEPSLSQKITQVTPAFPYALRLRDLAYSDTWTSNERTTDPYLTDILDHCILDLKELAMLSGQLPLVVSRIPLHHTLSLRSLSVAFPVEPEPADGLPAVALLQILHACPQLQHLCYRGEEFPDVDVTHYLPIPDLPNLSTFSGPCRLLQMVSRGAKLVRIYTYDRFYPEKQLPTHVILSTPTHLRVLYMAEVFISSTPHDFLASIQSLAVFRNLERLDIAHRIYPPWKYHVSAQDSHNTIKELLSQLTCLRKLHINSSINAMEGYNVGCPLSKEGEPANRGHPSLESICVDFLCGAWFWNSQTGWGTRI